MKHKKKIVLLIWLTIALPTFALTWYYNQDFFSKKENESLKKVEVVSATNSPTSLAVIKNTESESLPKAAPTPAPTATAQSIIQKSDASLQEPEQTETFITYETIPVPFSTPVPTLEPLPTPAPVQTASVIIENLGSFSTDLQNNDTVFSVLLRTARENNFEIEYKNYGSLGIFINCIAEICNQSGYYWVFYYNGEYSSVGVSLQPIYNSDIITWKFEKH